MSFHFCTHPWEVQDVQDGILVSLTRRDLDPTSIGVLVDDLFELVLESGQRNLHLDFGEVQILPSIVIGKMIALNARLRERRGRLMLINLDPVVYEMFRNTRVIDILDVRQSEPAEANA
jgi:anti-anti-sigma regulatory factor